jgi:hypothetical protein
MKPSVGFSPVLSCNDIAKGLPTSRPFVPLLEAEPEHRFRRLLTKHWCEGIMAAVMIVCPETGQDVSTGIETDPSSFESFTATAVSRCPVCGYEHAWSNRNAWLAAGLSASAPLFRQAPQRSGFAPLGWRRHRRALFPPRRRVRSTPAGGAAHAS